MTASLESILLVDDNDDLRKVTAEILESLGYRVITASRGERALRLVEGSAGDADLLLVEFALPGMSGLELADRLTERKPSLPVVVVSTHDTHPRLAARLDRGQTTFLRKPFTVEALQAAIMDARGRQYVGAPPPPVRPAPAVRRPFSSLRWWRRRTDPSLRGHWLLPWVVALAAAILVFTATGLARIDSLRSSLVPEWGETAAPRVAEIAALRPVGALEAMPGEVVWEEVEGAQSYAVTLQRVDDSVLWKAETSTSRETLPDTLLETLRPRVIYSWWVEAFDAEGNLLARSKAVPFEVIPATGG